MISLAALLYLIGASLGGVLGAAFVSYQQKSGAGLTVFYITFGVVAAIALVEYLETKNVGICLFLGSVSGVIAPHFFSLYERRALRLSGGVLDKAEKLLSKGKKDDEV